MYAIFSILIAALLIIPASGCRLTGVGVPADELAEANILAPVPTPQSTPRRADVEAAELCSRIGEIKKLPHKDPNDTDPIYEEMVARGNAVVPCLVEQITNQTPMRDPRSAPVWQHYKVGDTAIFLLADITGKQLEEMLPPKYRAEWETNGVYAYFNYVLEAKNRQQLQRWWRTWVKDNPAPIATPSPAVGSANTRERNEATEVGASDRSYIGCWSSYNGTSLRISRTALSISNNRFLPVHYTQISDRGKDGDDIVIRLDDRPRFHFFRKFLSLRFGRNEFGTREMKVVPSDEPADLYRADLLNRTAWVPDDCPKSLTRGH